jgi:hypothetical protein
MRSFPSVVGSLWLLGAAIGQGCIDEGGEPNDFLGVPTVAGCGMCADGVLTPGDTDYYSVLIAAPTLLRAYTGYGKASAAAVDTVVEIRDAGDLLLASDDDAGLGLWSYAGCNITVPGLYYVVVRGFGAATAGAYTLHTLCDTPVAPETPEPNGDPLLGGAPCPAACGMQHAGEIAVAGDTDWWAFAHAGGPLTITTGPSGPDVPAGLALVDTTIELFDVLSIAVLGSFDDDGGEALYSSTSLPAVAPGIYFVQVAGFGPGTGHYSLRIGCGEPASLLADVLYPAAAPPGCIGALSYRAAAPGGARVRPRLGTTFPLDASGLPPGSPVFHVIGLSLLAPPVPLAPFGAPPACFLAVSTDATTFAFTNALGEAKICLFVPDVPAFIGITLHFQTLTLVPLGATNVVTGVIGNLAFP